MDLLTDRPAGRPLLLLATCREWPAGEPGHESLDAALAARGIRSRWACWDDESVDWAEADLVTARATWDYVGRRDEFLAWAERIGPRLVHGPDVFRWNTDKRYLVTLAEAGVAVVPTVLARTEAEVRAILRRAGPCVVKPAVGADGLGVERVDTPDWVARGTGPWVVQPLVESVLTEGETSVFVIDGRAVAQLRKTPADGEIRVHEQYGGRTVAVAMDDEAVSVAAAACDAAGRLLGTDLVYARVDLLRHGGRLVVHELEVTEPGLYLDVMPENAAPFADAVARLAGVRAPS